MNGAPLFDIPVSEYGVYYEWVDLQVGSCYGKRTANVYNKVLQGTAGYAPVGVWDANGAYAYVPGFEPSSQTLALLKSSLQRLDLSAWVNEWDQRHGTWSEGWALTTSHLPLETLLVALRSDFMATNPPVPVTEDVTASSQIAQVLPAIENDDVESHILEEDGGPHYSSPSMRFVLAQSWWIASELVHRHPELLIHETHPGGGMYDCLDLLTLRPFYTLVMLNRAGRLHVADNPGFHCSWEQTLSAESPHAIIKMIEQAASLKPPRSTPASSKRVLAYRFIAAALHAAVNDRHIWDARNDFIDTADAWSDDPDVHGFLQQFSIAHKDAESAPRLGLWHEPESHFWALLRDEEPVALISIEGKVYTRTKQFELQELYSARRSMATIVTKVLSEYL